MTTLPIQTENKADNNSSSSYYSDSSDTSDSSDSDSSDTSDSSNSDSSDTSDSSDSDSDDLTTYLLEYNPVRSSTTRKPKPNPQASEPQSTAVLPRPSNRRPTTSHRSKPPPSSSSSSSSAPYRKVKMLSLVWKEHDLTIPSSARYNSVDKEAQAVRHAFRTLNYCTDKYQIQTQHPTSSLRRRLKKLRKYERSKTLIIIYYSGHGSTNGGFSFAKFVYFSLQSS
jgi:hypothetical protein